MRRKSWACPSSTSPMTWVLWPTWRTAWPSCTPARCVEYGTVQEIFYDAWHPYTWALLQALPQLGTKGEPAHRGRHSPNLFNEIHGDAFAPATNTRWRSTSWQNLPFFQVSRDPQQRPGIGPARARGIERPHSIQKPS